MTNATLTRINVTVYSSHLTDEVIPEVDLIASAEAYCNELRDEITEAYPDAAVNVDVQHRVQGVGSGVTVEHEDGETAMVIKDSCERIAERVHELGRFWV